MYLWSNTRKSHQWRTECVRFHGKGEIFGTTPAFTRTIILHFTVWPYRLLWPCVIVPEVASHSGEDDELVCNRVEIECVIFLLPLYVSALSLVMIPVPLVVCVLCGWCFVYLTDVLLKVMLRSRCCNVLLTICSLTVVIRSGPSTKLSARRTRSNEIVM